MKKRKISTIEFFWEHCEPQYGYDVGFHKINGVWMRARVKINGEEPDCRAIDIREFDKMLAAPGDYEPFTCTCGYMEDADIQYPVRCLHKDDLIILVVIVNDMAVIHAVFGPEQSFVCFRSETSDMTVHENEIDSVAMAG